MESLAFPMKKLALPLKKAHSFRILISELFMSTKFINMFWIGNKVFLGAGVFMSTFSTCSKKQTVYNSAVFRLKRGLRNSSWKS